MGFPRPRSSRRKCPSAQPLFLLLFVCLEASLWVSADQRAGPEGRSDDGGQVGDRTQTQITSPTRALLQGPDLPAAGEDDPSEIPSVKRAARAESSVHLCMGSTRCMHPMSPPTPCRWPAHTHPSAFLCCRPPAPPHDHALGPWASAIWWQQQQ